MDWRGRHVFDENEEGMRPQTIRTKNLYRLMNNKNFSGQKSWKSKRERKREKLEWKEKRVRKKNVKQMV